jgi:hypothetical protein
MSETLRGQLWAGARIVFGESAKLLGFVAGAFILATLIMLPLSVGAYVAVSVGGITLPHPPKVYLGVIAGILAGMSVLAILGGLLWKGLEWVIVTDE